MIRIVSINIFEATYKCDVNLNTEMLQFKQTSVDFYSRTLTEKGIHLATWKMDESCNLKTQSNVKKCQNFLGMVSYLNWYLVKLAYEE